MSRRQTILERVRPNVEEFCDLATRWKPDALNILFMYFWKGCDALAEEIIKPAGGASQTDISLERTLNSKLSYRIQKFIPHNCPFYFQHKPDEFASLQSPSAQPPEPDFAFISINNERCMLPIEAKLLMTDGQIADYIKEIHDNFLTCRYGPYSKTGAMLGYLLKGAPDTVFVNISKKLLYSLSVPKTRRISCKLTSHTKFSGRNHKISKHKRKSTSQTFGGAFSCHHMILEIGNNGIN